MLHGLILILCMLFPLNLSGYFFAFIVTVLNIIDIRLSASGVLAISLQIGITLIALIINFLSVNRRKYEEQIKKFNSTYLNKLIILLVTAFWVYLLMVSFNEFKHLSLNLGTSKLKENFSSLDGLITGSVSILFSFIVVSILFNFLYFLRGKSNELL